MKESGLPHYDLPPILLTDGDDKRSVVRLSELKGFHLPLTLESKLLSSKRHYEKTPTPGKQIYDAEYIEQMQAKLDTPEMKDHLSSLRR